MVGPRRAAPVFHAGSGQERCKGRYAAHPRSVATLCFDLTRHPPSKHIITVRGSWVLRAILSFFGGLFSFVNSDQTCRIYQFGHACAFAQAVNRPGQARALMYCCKHAGLQVNHPGYGFVDYCYRATPHEHCFDHG